MRVLVWHVHGSWTTAFVQGSHQYLLPVLPGRGPYGRGRAMTWEWPSSAMEATPEELRDSAVDVVVLQRREELDLAERWLGIRPGVDVPAVYVEHNTPEGPVRDMHHPAACAEGVTVVHVSWFNRLMWDTGNAPVRVIEHGVVDPGYHYSGELARAAVVINEPLRRGRVTGTDLLGAFERSFGVDVFGIGSEPLGGTDLPQAALHLAMGRRRLYLHTTRWTSLGLSLVEAMHLGMPVVALATTEAPEAVPPAAGVVSNRPHVLFESVTAMLADPEGAVGMGQAARRYALERYGLERFLKDWDALLEEVVG